MNCPVIAEGRAAWRIGEASEVSVLVDAEAYYRSFCSAALLAERHIYIAGWQFDTKARLLRPAPESPPEHPIELLTFLNYLCERTPGLHIYIAAWDYSLVYAIEREWMQKLKFDFQSHPRVHFEFTNHPDAGGCYHRKLVIVDDEVAFLGGLDLCDSRWDTRRHAKRAPERIDLGGRPYKPFHDIQVGLRGPIVEPLSELFWDDWRRATGQAPESAAAEPGSSSIGEGSGRHPRADAFSLAALSGGLGLPLGARRVALSRTECDPEGRHAVGEIQQLLERAIGAAEQLIYIETQYFTSRSLAEALCHRLADTSRSKLQVVLLMPDGADSPKEDFVLGNRQRAIRHLVASFARHFGHEFRLLLSSESTPEDPVLATFIHSKLIIVDDELASIGSANLTNRSMRVDFELNASWEAALEDPERAARLRADIRALRASLLAEHAGSRDAAFFEPLEALVQRIDAACADAGGKLQLQEAAEPSEDNPLLIAIFDPSGPLDWDTLDQSIEEAFDSDEGFVKRTAQKLGQRLGVVDVND
jgi:phosphatidylserine/phosphatidylglycerophosphate/cardiolipin synthase-like enzyme